MNSKVVEIRGAGCISAAGMSLEDHFKADALCSSVPVPVPPSLFSTELSHPVFAVQGDGLSDSAGKFLRSIGGLDETLRLNRTEKFFLTAIVEAIQGAGISQAELSCLRVGIAAGTTVGSTFTDHDGYQAWISGEMMDTEGVKGYLQGNLAMLAHSLLGTSGPAAVVVNACSSGTDAIGLGAMWIREGLCDICLAGGADELSVIPYHGFSSLQLLDDSPCRPFDVSRSGLNLGEGAACLVLENSASTCRQKLDSIGRILGYGASSDAWHPTAPHPEGRGLSQAICSALEDAGVSPSDISLINAHGTGTVANDLAESRAIRTVFNDSSPPVVSTKGATGHTLGAAGAIEVVLTLAALSAGKAMGTSGCKSPDPGLEIPVLREEESAELSGRVGISQSLAFGGGNSALVIEAK